MRVLITGGYGFIGAWIIRNLLARGDRVWVFDLKEDPRRLRQILPEAEVRKVEFVQGDFRDEAVLEQVLQCVGADKVDLVLSDMAPNMAGIDAVDQPRSMHLAELALEFADRVLAPGGDLLVKLYRPRGARPSRRGRKALLDLDRVLNRLTDDRSHEYASSRGAGGFGTSPGSAGRRAGHDSGR